MKLGDKSADFYALLAEKKSVGYIANALDDLIGKKDAWLERHISADVRMLEELGLKVEVIDLKDYFGASSKLAQYLTSLSGVWVSGGNVFVLRQAMHLSGLER